MNQLERIDELKEKRDEFILNESVFEDDSPSWKEVAEANATAEQQWDQTHDGKELSFLLTQLYDEHIEAYDKDGTIPVCKTGEHYYDIHLDICPWCGFKFYTEEEGFFHCPKCCMEIEVVDND